MRRAIYSVLIAFIVLATLLTVLLGTEPGSRWLVQRGVALAPGELTIERVRGTLLQGLELEGVRYEDALLDASLDELEIRVNALALFAGRLSVTRLRVEGLDLVMHPAPDEPGVESEPFRLPDSVAVPLAIDLSDVEFTRVSLRFGEGEPLRIDAMGLAATVDDGQARIHAFSVETPDLGVELAAEAGLAMPYPLGLELDWRLRLPESVAGGLEAEDARGRLVLDGDLERLGFRHRVLAPVRLAGEGELRDLAGTPGWRLEQRWEPLGWRLPDGRHLALETGQLTSEGTLDDYRLTLATTLTVPDLPPQQVEFTGQGNLERLEELRLASRSAAGELVLAGTAGWLEVPFWDLRIEGDALDPALIDPQLMGRLALRARSDGRLDPESGLAASLDLERLDGRLRDYPVSARGSARLEDGVRVVTPGIEARIGGNRLDLAGQVDVARPDLRLAIDAPSLDALWPGLRGRLTGNGRLAGSWREPSVDLRLSGRETGYGDLQVASLDLQARGTLQANSSLTLDLALAGVTQGGAELAERVALTGRGPIEAHHLTLEADTAEGRLGLRLEGGVSEGPRWAGRLTRFDLDETRLGAWRLTAPARLEADAQTASLSLLCLAQDDARLCVEGSRDPESGRRAVVDLTDFPLTLLDPFLPENARLEGQLSAGARLRDEEGLEVLAQLRTRQAVLQVQGLNGAPESIRIRALAADASLRDGGLDASASLSFAQGGRASAKLTTRPEGETHRLDGEARASLSELRWVEALAPELREVTGRIEADLTLAGTLENPDFHGELRLADGRFQVPNAGTVVEQVALHARARGLDRLILNGEAHSGPGRIVLAGELGLRPNGAPWAELGLSGERFLAVQRREADVLVSPDLALTLEARNIDLTGTLTIPEASIELRELPPQAVSVSPDEVIVDAPPVEASPWQVHTRVTLILGDRVRLSAFGLSARLAGEVAVDDRPPRPVRAEGEIRIEDGRYKAYGQDLTVERGVLVFQGPADNPGLDIRAVRHVPDYEVTAGIAIGGTLQEPRSRVFSEPAMEDSEAMAFLLTGRPLSGASESDAGVLMTAITSFGLEQGGLVTRQVGQAVGIDEVVLESEGQLEQSALMLGKHLSSRLYVRYTVGLFERASVLMLRYKLTRSLSLETQTSGEAQSMDLIYRIER